MAEAHEAAAKARKGAATGSAASLGKRLTAFVLKPPPREFTAATFAARTGQHFVVYMAVLIVAIIACLVISARL